MSEKHPMDSVPMPAYSQIVAKCGQTMAMLLHRTKWKDGIDIEVLDNGLQDLIKAERLSAYEMGRNEERAAIEKICGDIGPDAYKVFQAIQEMKR